MPHPFRKASRQLFRRTHKGMAEECRIHKGLAPCGEIHKIRGFRIRGGIQAAQGLLPPDGLQLLFLFLKPFRFQPGRKPQHASSEGLQRCIFRPFLMKIQWHGFM